MTRIGCSAHDYGKLPAAELAAALVCAVLFLRLKKS